MSRRPSSTSASDDSALVVLLAKFPLERWLQRHGFKLQSRARGEYVHACPWCGSEDKLSVNPRLRRHRCFVCHKGFDLIDLLAQFEGGYAKAVEVVKTAVGGRSLAFIPDADLVTAPAPPRDPHWTPWPIAPPEHFVPLVEHHPYTARRGFDLDNVRRLGVGVCSWGLYQDRLVFPVRRFDGYWIYFQSRATWEKDEHTSTTKYRKNLNPANADPARFASASDVLLGLECLGGARRVAVVEGPTDWLQAGPDAVALLGKVISDRQVQLLVQAGVTEVDLCLDPDAWQPPSHTLPDGRVMPMRRLPPAKAVADRLAQHFTVRVVRYADGMDPGACTVAVNRALRAAAAPWGDGARLALLT